MEMNRKDPGIAAVLSFLLPGLGQIYNGQILKGLIFIACYAISWVLLFVLIGILLLPLIWIIGIYDAHGSAKSINEKIERRIL